MDEITCHFSLRCPRQWDQLLPTNDPEIRHCSNCKSDVYLVKNQTQLSAHTGQSHCVAFKEADQLVLGIPAGIDHVEYILRIPAHPISGKKLYAIRRILRTDLSLPEAKDEFDMKTSEIEGYSHMELQAKLAQLTAQGIEAEIVSKTVHGFT